MCVVEVGIAECGRHLGMAQQPADHRDRLGTLDGVAGEGVADVMDAKAHDAGAFLDLVPVSAHVLDLLAHLPIPEQPFDFWMSSQRRMIDHRARLGAKPDGAAAGFRIAQLDTHPVDVGPFEVEDFAVPAAGEKKQHDGGGKARVQAVPAIAIRNQCQSALKIDPLIGAQN